MLFILSSFFINPSKVYAEESQNESTFFVRPLLTSNQNKEVSDYFDIQLSPENEQTLQIEIHNNTPEEKTFSAVIENAITNDHAVIEYQHESDDYDPTLKTKFSDIAEMEPSVTIKPRSISKMSVLVKMPKEEFDGIILGGIRISEIKAEDQDTGSISNIFSYVVPVKISENETVVPNALNFQGVTIGQQTYQNIVKAKLQNPQPKILRDLMIEAKIYKKNGEEVLFEEKKEDLKLAPNSNFAYAISLEESEFEAGHYRLVLSAKAEDLNEEWTEEFEITRKEAKELNNQLVFKPQSNNNLPIFIVVFVLLFVVVIFLLYRQKKLKQEAVRLAEEKKMQKRKRVKKRVEKGLIFFLLFSGLTYGEVVSAESQGNSDVSTATITLKPQPIKTKPSSSTVSKKVTANKKLPQTNEQSHFLGSFLGTLLIFSGAILLIKKGRRKLA